MSFEDLPLFPSAESPESDSSARREEPLAPRAPDPPATFESETAEPPPLVPQPRYQLHPARFGQRLLSFVFDCAVLSAVAVGSALGARTLGVRVTLGDWMPLALFVLAFSFLYASVPLAVWGRTPGMASVGLVARSPGNRPLTFRQAVVRWGCGMLTAALAGLPALLSLSGSSLADRASGSATLSRR